MKKTISTPTTRFCQPLANGLFASSKRVAYLLLTVSLLSGFVGCSSKNEVTPAGAGEYVSYKIDGQAYTDNDPSSVPSTASLLSIYCEGKLSSGNTSTSHTLELNTKTPKVGTFTAQNSQLTGRIFTTTVGTSISSQTYTLPDKGNGTLTITYYKTKDFAEGTFSFSAADAKTGKTVNVTDGKFRIELF